MKITENQVELKSKKHFNKYLNRYKNLKRKNIFEIIAAICRYLQLRDNRLYLHNNKHRKIFHADIVHFKLQIIPVNDCLLTFQS